MKKKKKTILKSTAKLLCQKKTKKNKTNLCTVLK